MIKAGQKQKREGTQREQMKKRFLGTRIPDPPFSSFGPTRDYGMYLSLEVYL